MTLDIDLAGFAPKALARARAIIHPDLKATNTAEHPDQVVPAQGQGRVGRDGRERSADKLRSALLAHASASPSSGGCFTYQE